MGGTGRRFGTVIGPADTGPNANRNLFPVPPITGYFQVARYHHLHTKDFHMPMHNFLFLVAGVLILAGSCFWLGWDIAEGRERKAKAYLDKNLKAAIKRERNIHAWIEQNWPTELAAYNDGHLSGYQQGVSQSSALDEDE